MAELIVKIRVCCSTALAACAALATTAVADTQLIEGRPGWTRMSQEESLTVARESIAAKVLDAELYYFGSGDVVFGRMLGDFELTQISGRDSVCVAGTWDLFIPSLQKLREGLKYSHIVRGADLQIAAFAPTLDGCVENYTRGSVVYVHGSLSAAHLVAINRAMDRKLAALCKIPPSATPNGLLQAADGVYNLYPRFDKSNYREPLEVEVSFAVDGDVYEAVSTVGVRSVRLTECVKAVMG